jgi:hypothetical protein
MLKLSGKETSVSPWLLVNISPQLLSRPELYQLFGNNCVEFEVGRRRGRCCSPRHRLPCDSLHEGSTHADDVSCNVWNESYGSL